MKDLKGERKFCMYVYVLKWVKILYNVHNLLWWLYSTCTVVERNVMHVFIHRSKNIDLYSRAALRSALTNQLTTRMLKFIVIFAWRMCWVLLSVKGMLLQTITVKPARYCPPDSSFSEDEWSKSLRLTESQKGHTVQALLSIGNPSVGGPEDPVTS